MFSPLSRLIENNTVLESSRRDLSISAQNINTPKWQNLGFWQPTDQLTRIMNFTFSCLFFVALTLLAVDSYNLSSKSAVSRSFSSSFTPSLASSTQTPPTRTTNTLGFVLKEPSNEGGMTMKKGKPNVPPMMRGQYKQQQQM